MRGSWVFSYPFDPLQLPAFLLFDLIQNRPNDGQFARVFMLEMAPLLRILRVDKLTTEQPTSLSENQSLFDGAELAKLHERMLQRARCILILPLDLLNRRRPRRIGSTRCALVVRGGQIGGSRTERHGGHQRGTRLFGSPLLALRRRWR